MIPNREDRLVRFAFGDVDERETAEIEGLIANDPEARRTVEQYQTMRFDLGSLREVPEDQMSHERLRDAILARGLRTDAVPERSKFGWAWMPLAACVLAFAYVMVPRSTPTVEPTLVARNESKPAATFGMASTIVRKAVAPPVKKTVVKPIEKSGIEVPVKPKARRSEPDRFDHSELIVQVPSKDEASEASQDDLKGLQATNDKQPQPTPAVVTPTPEPGSDAPIVIVEPSPSEGTNAAQEVESTSNVLVGG